VVRPGSTPRGYCGSGSSASGIKSPRTCCPRASAHFGESRWSSHQPLWTCRRTVDEPSQLLRHAWWFAVVLLFGDWHSARIYQNLSARFHLADWHRTIDEKLKTLDDLYQLLRNEQNNRTMLFLEVFIVVLFVIDLVILAVGHR